MEYYHEIMLYIVGNEPLTSIELAEHFQWSEFAKLNWMAALREWGWIVPRGRVESTEKGRGALVL